jgi:hypothetical protein
VGRKLHTKFGVDPTVSEFSMTFFQAKSMVLSGYRDVIVGDVTSSPPQNNFRVARNRHAKFGADWTVSEFFRIFSSKIRI